MGLSLYRANHDALDEEFLNEGVQGKHGEAGNEDDRILHGFRQVCQTQGLFENALICGTGIDVFVGVLRGDQDVAQHQLQGIQLLIPDI